jgi:ubiquinone/menaquinone biosynthesis C-methylase UbiE
MLPSLGYTIEGYKVGRCHKRGMATLNSKQYKQGQRQSWNSVAAGWQKWCKTIEIGAEKVSSWLIELSDMKLGSRVLDLATGIGEPAITAAKHVGSSGHVLAIDISSQMLSIAEQRAISLGLQDVVESKGGQAETIDLPTAKFDAVLFRWRLMFLPDLSTGLSNIYRSLVDGGRLADVVWASPDKASLTSLTMNTIMKETNSPPPPAGTPGPFSLSDDKVLMNSLITSGSDHFWIQRC